MIHIDVWCDINVPGCYHGKHNLDKALKELRLQDEVEVEWKSLETKRDKGTWHAHRFIQMAKKIGFSWQDRIVERLFKAKYDEGKDLADRETLKKLADEAGLNREEADEILRTDEFADDVLEDESEAQELGIQNVPFFLIDGKIALSGPQSQEAFKEALVKVTGKPLH